MGNGTLKGTIVKGSAGGNMQGNLQGNLLGNLMGNLTGNNNINAFVKPADWPDIRQSAKCISLLVANVGGAYPKFGCTTTVIGGYTVYIDGVKYGDFASAAQCNIDWTAYSATPGTAITYPAAATAHIVEIAAQTAGTPITIYKNARTTGSANENHGLLWAHFNCSNDNTGLVGAFYTFGGYNSPIMEAMTCLGNVFKSTGISNIVTSSFNTAYNMPNFKYAPIFDIAAASNAYAIYYTYFGIVQSVVIKNKSSAITRMDGVFALNRSLKKVTYINCDFTGVVNMDETHRYNQSLISLPKYLWAAVTTARRFLTAANSLEDTVLDVSAATGLTQIGCYTLSSLPRMDGFKGLIVSNAAPFSGTAPQIQLDYTGMTRTALITLFNSMPTVTGKTISIVGCTGAADLTAGDLAIATGKGWTVLR